MPARLTSEGPFVFDDLVVVRKMRDDEADYRLLSAWLSDPRVLEYYEGRDNPHDVERIRGKYSPRAQGLEGVVPCIIGAWFPGPSNADGEPVDPIGYIQYYPLSSETFEEYRIDPARSAFGIDLFIGRPELWGRGLGTRALRLLMDYLFEAEGAELITIDPYLINPRAIRAYEKAGFNKVRILPRHDLHEGVMQDSWLMVSTRGS